MRPRLPPPVRRCMPALHLAVHKHATHSDALIHMRLRFFLHASMSNVSACWPESSDTRARSALAFNWSARRGASPPWMSEPDWRALAI